MEKALPAPSLRELARPKGVTEGVSSDGCFGPMVFTPAHINSEIFERLRSSKYTPSASLRSAAPSGREPGTALPLTQPPGNRKGAGDFHRPYETQRFLHFAIQRTTLPQSASLTAPSEREPGRAVPFNVSPKNRNVTGDIHRPEKAGAMHPVAWKLQHYGI